MLWTIFVVLLVLWFFGLVTSYTLGGFIHILLVVAVAVLLIQLIAGRPRWVIAIDPRLPSKLGIDLQRQIRLWCAVLGHQPSSCDPSLTTWSRRDIATQPVAQAEVIIAMSVRDWRSHVYDSVDQLRELQVRHPFPAAKEFIARQAIAVSQARRQNWSGHRLNPLAVF